MDPDQVRQDIRPDLGQNRLVSLLFLAPRMDSLVTFAHAQSRCFNKSMHIQLPRWARGPNFLMALSTLIFS